VAVYVVLAWGMRLENSASVAQKLCGIRRLHTLRGQCVTQLIIEGTFQYYGCGANGGNGSQSLNCLTPALQKHCQDGYSCFTHETND
jgi:hypothetical protein